MPQDLLHIYVMTTLVMLPVAVLLWFASLIVKKVSFVDTFWGAGFVMVTWVGSGIESNFWAYTLPQQILIILVTIWGMRLAIYLGHRFLLEGEDKRYVQILTRTKLPKAVYSLVFVFLMQTILILAIASPILGYLAGQTPNLDIWAGAGILLWLVGFGFEAIADYQMAHFKANPQNIGKVMDHGLWAWSRHPNYFGDACVWWGFWLFGHDPIFIVAPLFMTFSLIKWSGIPHLEPGLKKRRPGYDIYQKEVSAFFPRPRRKLLEKPSSPGT